MTPVTVVVPTHRRSDLLCRLLDSLAAQTYPASAFDVVVVGSPADPGEGVCRGRPGVRFLTLPHDPWAGRNPSAKRNHGAQVARGDWLAFVDDDCVADPGWLAAAAGLFPGAAALEGAKRIPPVDPPTFTYKGLKRFERPGGYQSCNMFLRRDVFLAVGGFDPRFPFYLEDTDLAWTVLDAGHAIPHAAGAVVEHPVAPPDPWRLWADANRAGRLALLRRKHPARWRAANTRVLAPWHRAVLALQLLAAAAVGATLAGIPGAGWVAAGACLAAAGVCLAVARRWFRGCRVTVREVAVTTWLIPWVPAARAARYALGRWHYRRAAVKCPPLEPPAAGAA